MRKGLAPRKDDKIHAFNLYAVIGLHLSRKRLRLGIKP